MSSCHFPLNPSIPPPKLYIFDNPLSPGSPANVLMSIAIGPSSENLPVATLSKKSDSSSPNSHHLTVTPQERVELESSTIYSGILSGFILYRFCASNHS